MGPIFVIATIVVMSLSISANANLAGFTLGLQWPAGFCETDSGCDSKHLLNTFTIHALYPYNSYGTLLRNCSGTEFDVNSVSNFVAEMHLAWPSHVTYTTDAAFWESAWNSNGKCSEGVLKQTSYFKTSLAFREIFDIVTLLEREGIHPNNALYSPKSIKEAIRKNLNAVPALRCNQNKNSKFVLTEIKPCLNKYATRFVDCPASLTDAECNTNPLKFTSLTRILTAC